jgi:cyclophilin family peptidyl-prolyl cis-trans isomerase
MKTFLILAAAAAAAAVTPAPKPAPAPSEIVAAVPKGDWVAIAPADLLVMDLASGKRVVIQLMPPPFSGRWVGNIRKLAAAHWWDGTSINRVQDNYVVQWGDATEKKALPEGLATVREKEYFVSAKDLSVSEINSLRLNDEIDEKYKIAEPYTSRTGETCSVNPTSDALEDCTKTTFERGPLGDSFARYTTHNGGWQIASNLEAIWPVHCYGMVGVGRDMPPDTGTGAELYTVIGHAPRHLDRNIALVGRVISGIEHLSSLPRGTGPLGFYEKPGERTGISSIRIGTEVKDLARFESLSTESASFAKYADARANRRDPFFIVPAGGADICNIPVPVRVVK